MTSTNISATDAQNFYNVTLETCAGKYEDYTFPINTRELILNILGFYPMTMSFILWLHSRDTYC